MKRGRVVKTERGFGILAEFEIGGSGEYTQRMLISGVSHKKAELLLKKWLTDTETK